MIMTSRDEFGCGYCRVKGGVDELKGRRPPVPYSSEKKVISN
jgi:hypothetical protein